MRLAAELFRPEPHIAMTLEDRISGERAAERVIEAGNEVRLATLQMESLTRAQQSIEAFSNLYAATLESNGSIDGLEASYRLTLENFFGAEFAVEAEFSQEGMINLVKRIGRATLNAGGRIQRGWKDFTTSITGSYEGLEKRAEDVLRGLDDIDRKAVPIKDTIKVAGGSRLHIKTSMEPKDLVDNYAKSIEATTAFVAETTQFGRGLLDRIETTQKEIFKFNAKTEKDQIVKLQTSSKVAIEKEIEGYISAVKGLDGTVLPGGQMMKTAKLTQFTIAMSSRDVPLTQISVFNANAFGTYREKDQVTAPTMDQMRTLVAFAKASVSSLEDMVDKGEVLLTDASEMSKAKGNLPLIQQKLPVGKIFNGKEGLIDIAEVMIGNYFGNNVTVWMEYLLDNIIEAYGYIFQTSRAMIEYCERGLANYEK
jgi:hypothetical protein